MIALPGCYGQPTNISAHGEFNAEEVEALGLQPLPDNLGAKVFTAVAYNANVRLLRQRETIVTRLTADDIFSKR
jgi:Fe-S cluster biosynthesis and repair protein YggX